jgi:hypothetical protein
MGKTFTIASIFLLLNFVAFAQIPSDSNLRIGVNSLSETNFSGTVSNTQPDVQYEIQRKQGRTNWVSVGFVYGSEATNWTPFDFRTTNAVNSKAIRVRSWIDSRGVGMADWWQLRYFGDVGIDPYGNPEGDGWSNMQKYQNGMDPFTWYEPSKPVFTVRFQDDGSNARKGRAVLTWQCQNGTIPDYFLIERANRTLRPITNDSRIMRPVPYGTNGRFLTNRPPNFHPPSGRPDWRHEDSLITGPFELVARIPGQPGVRDYRYVETNVDTLFQPAYRIQPHYSPPLQIRLTQVNAAAIRETILPVVARQTTNGYDLTVTHPIAYGSYLLLVRDKNDPQWRASGYFSAGTNRSPVHVHVDAKGMMSDGQSPIAMPAVKFLPDVIDPEFTAGWGKDSDYDGLPDIYEVLVTHTEPDNADTGDTGTLDGCKRMTSDGLSNFEKFRCRVDPLYPAQPPAIVELKQPTGFEIAKTVTPKSDLCCELQIEVRTNGALNFQPVEQVPWMAGRILNFQQPSEPRHFDLRVSWHFSEIMLNQRGDWNLPPEYQAIQSIMAKADIQLFEIFSNNLATNPPLSRKDMTNAAATMERAYRAGEMDKGLIMAEMMLLEDSQPQYFYGKVIDQYGQTVVGAAVTLQVSSEFGRGGTYKTNTDADGCFQFAGLRGKSLSVTAEKKGYQNAGQGLGLKRPSGSDTSADNRAAYIMWKLKGPEPMFHNEISSRKIQPDGRTFTIDFEKNRIVEGTNVSGDILVQIHRPLQIKPREQYDWSFTMTAIAGGFIEATNDVYLNEAPTTGYQPQYQMNRYATNVYNYSTHELYRTDRTFFLKSRGGQVYGHFRITDLEPDCRGGMAALRIDSFVNPSSSRNLEFDPAKQIQ